MIHRIIQFSLRQKPIVLFLVAFMAVGGAVAFHSMPVDAYPDLLSLIHISEPTRH